MEWADEILGILMLILAAIILFLQLRGGGGAAAGPDAAVMAEVATLREAMERRIAGLSTDQMKSQLEFLDRLTRSSSELMEKQRRELADSIGSMRQELAGVLAALRDELKKGATDQLKTMGEVQAAVSDRLAASIEAQRKLAAEARAEAAEAIEKVRKELGDSSAAQVRTLGELQEQIQARLKASVEEQRKLAGEAGLAQADASTKARREAAEEMEKLRKALADNAAAQVRTLTELQAQIHDRLKATSDAQRESADKARETIAAQLGELRKENEARLEKLRETVDEKLQTALEKRLGESFKQVSERLEQVHKGLGEMQQLATGVGDLKKVLTNVRSRGTYGEVQLRALLEQVMNASQYRENVSTRPGSSERVEFAVVLPGKGDADRSVLLPIDAKFPQEDYQRLQQAYEDGDGAAVDAARKALAARILGEGKRIGDKYIESPHTTDFALMFLPTEGLFAEVLRLPGLAERLQTDYKVMITGPTTLYAILNSLTMGFRTLAIEKRSSEVWNILAAVKTEFGKFGEALDGVAKNLSLAQDKLDTLQKTRSNAIRRKLREVQELPAADAPRLLGIDGKTEVEEEE